MKLHTTNYINTFIEIAEDCPTNTGEIPPLKGSAPSVANLQFDLLNGKPYEFTSDDVFFAVYAQRSDISPAEMEAQRQQFFSKGQPCFRASPLTKRYGWGVHSDEQGKVALFAADSQEYQRFLDDHSVKKVKAMRTKK